jgi:hypothetical protein
MSLLDKLFNDAYYEMKNFEKDGKIYELLEIKTFKKAVMKLAYKEKVENYNLMTYSIKGLEDYEKKSRSNEKIHFIGFIIMLFPTLAMCFFFESIRNVILFLLLIFINLCVNFYPVCLQRYNRIRIRKVLSRKKGSQNQ